MVTQIITTFATILAKTKHIVSFTSTKNELLFTIRHGIQLISTPPGTTAPPPRHAAATASAPHSLP